MGDWPSRVAQFHLYRAHLLNSISVVLFLLQCQIQQTLTQKLMHHLAHGWPEGRPRAGGQRPAVAG